MIATTRLGFRGCVYCMLYVASASVSHTTLIPLWGRFPTATISRVLLRLDDSEHSSLQVHWWNNWGEATPFHGLWSLTSSCYGPAKVRLLTMWQLNWNLNISLNSNGVQIWNDWIDAIIDYWHSATARYEVSNVYNQLRVSSAILMRSLIIFKPLTHNRIAVRSKDLCRY